MIPGIVAGQMRAASGGSGDVISLLHFDDAVGSTMFVDSASGVVWYGGGVVRDQPLAFGGRDLKLSGSDQDGVVHPLGGYGYDVLTEPFTLEFFVAEATRGQSWLYSIGGGTVAWLASASGLDLLVAVGGGTLQLQLRSGGGSPYILETVSMDLSPRHHVAVSRDTTLYRFFVDGTLIGTIPVASVPAVGRSGIARIGSIAGNSSTINTSTAAIDEMRFVRGAAVYTEPFTPPAAPFPNF